jgi:hypothetical protein
MIPRQRFDEVLGERNRLQEQIAQLNQRQAAATASGDDQLAIELDLSGKAMFDALMDNKPEEADGHFKTALIAAAKAGAAAALKQSKQFARSEAETVSVEQQVRTSIQVAAKEIGEKYPELDPGSEKTLLEEAKYYRNGFLSAGTEPGKAIRDAAEYVAMRHGLVKPAAATPAPAMPAAPAPVVNLATAQTKAAAAVAQPPSMAGTSSVAQPASGKSVAEMSEEEFNALPESKRAELRGDFAA